jgi:hypothetical protein
MFISQCSILNPETGKQDLLADPLPELNIEH